VEINVSDTGIGMDETTKIRIFEPFFTTKEIGKEQGLGSRRVGVVQEHLGFVDVESTVAEGSTFHVYLPVPEGAMSGSGELSSVGVDMPADRRRYSLSRMKISCENFSSHCLSRRVTGC